MKNPGQATLLVLLLLLTLMILGGTIAVIANAEIRTASLNKNSLAAFYLAQAGVELAKCELKYIQWQPNYYNGNLPGGNYSVNVMPGTSPGWLKITSTGRSGSSQKTIIVEVTNLTGTPNQVTEGWSEN